MTAATTTLPTDLTSKLTQLGAMERDALSTLQGWMPPRLLAARECTIAATAGKLKPSDAMACLTFYWGNKAPASHKVQVSKLAQFIKAGCAGYGVATIDAVGAYFVNGDAKAAAKFTGAERTLGNAYETTLKVIRGALDLSHAPSSDEIATILAPKADEDDTVVSLLESAKKYADSALGEAPEYKDDLLVISRMLAELAAKRVANIGAKPDATAAANTAATLKVVVETRANVAVPPVPTSASAEAAAKALETVDMESLLQIA